MEASTAKAYPDFGGSASEKTGRAESVSSLFYLRQFVARAMVVVHAISPELAEHHVSAMDDTELLARFRQYAGVELSAAGPKPRGEPISTRFLASPTTTADHAALNPVPADHSCRVEVVSCSLCPHARVGSKKPGPKAGAGFAPAAARVGNKKPGIVGHAERRRSREGS
jgi:hypothetical protein